MISDELAREALVAFPEDEPLIKPSPHFVLLALQFADSATSVGVRRPKDFLRLRDGFADLAAISSAMPADRSQQAIIDANVLHCSDCGSNFPLKRT